MSYKSENSKPTRIASALGFGAMLGLTGCIFSTDNGGSGPASTPVAVEKGILFAVTSDYQTAGGYAVFGLDSQFVDKSHDTLFKDVGVRYFGGDDIILLNRLGRDNMQIIGRHNLKTVLQFKFPALSNPQDVALKDSLFYVGFYADAKIRVYRQSDGAPKDSIDISAYADTSDHLPETSQLFLHGDKLYAILENLDTKHDYAPLQAKLLSIDLKTKAIQSLDLPFGNPLSIAFDSTTGKLFIPCWGVVTNPDYTLKLDGGIVAVKLSTFTVSDTLATEKSLGGSLSKAVLYNGKLYMGLTTAKDSSFADKLIAINLGDGKVTEILQTGGYAVNGLVVDEKTGTLFFGDKDLGLRKIDLATGLEKPDSKIKLDLPIIDLAIVR